VVMINANAGPLDPAGWAKPRGQTGPAAARTERSDPSNRDESVPPGDTVDLSGDDIHDQEALRSTAARLLASGDINASADDGSIRPDRIDAARRNVGNGTYSRRDVISGVVDRLLEQWQI